jgi:hypothetical protein
MMKSNSNVHGGSSSSDPMFTKLSAFGAVQRAFEILFGTNFCTFITIGLLSLPLIVVLAVVFVQSTTTSTTTTGDDQHNNSPPGAWSL